MCYACTAEPHYNGTCVWGGSGWYYSLSVLPWLTYIRMHMCKQTLFNKEYTFFSGSVVNNPHSYGVHRFAGAYPPSTYHWRSLGRATVPFVNHSRALEYYYGNNVVRW